MTEPEGRSLAKLGLVAVNGLECPQGGAHEVLEPELLIAAGEGGGSPRCMKCKQLVYLQSAKELEG